MALSLVSGMAVAGSAKEKDSSASYENNPTIGVLGARHGESEAVERGERHRRPSAPIAAPAVPKVEAETPQINLAPTAPLAAAPRPSVVSEGAPTGASAAEPPPAQVAPSTGFLPTHPVVSGLLAGLIGTGLGSLLYGGAMMGDETAAMIGYIIRIAAFGVIVVLALRWVAKLMSRDSEEGVPTRSRQRREPTFERRTESFDGRREPHFDRGSVARRD